MRTAPHVLEGSSEFEEYLFRLSNYYTIEKQLEAAEASSPTGSLPQSFHYRRICCISVGRHYHQNLRVAVLGYLEPVMRVEQFEYDSLSGSVRIYWSLGSRNRAKALVELLDLAHGDVPDTSCEFLLTASH